MTDWHQILDEQSSEPVVVTRDRLRWPLVLFALAMFVVFARAVQLEISDGANFRRLAARPIEQQVKLAPRRGRILARDGSVLAADRTATALAVHFRYLQDPADAAWLRRRARSKLTAAQRRDARRVAATEAEIREELARMHARLARLCGVPLERWQACRKQTDRRVTQLANLVNQRRLQRYREHAAREMPHEDDDGMAQILSGLFVPPAPLEPPPVIVVEQTVYHRLADDVPPNVAAEIGNHPDRYPGVRIVEHTRRDYPLATLAAHVVGHVGRHSGIDSQVALAASGEDVEPTIGLLGVERAFDAELAGRRGLAIQSTDHRGRVLTTETRRKPIAGGDVILSIDPALQRSAEMWLDRHTRRHHRRAQDASSATPGGAIVVLDVHTGELLAAASAPRFDPNLFVTGDPRLEQVLSDRSRPLFDRVTKMALPPGSVFKPLTALALVSETAVDPQEPFTCRGYLDDPGRLRCQIFRAHGIGHGDITLVDALARSCNVYFFHHAARLGGVRLVDWATRFGFGQPTGAALPDEAAGHLPTSDELHQPNQTQFLSVGQGAVTATPLQVARLYAAIANGGYLVTPRITRDRVERSRRSLRRSGTQPSASEQVPGLTSDALATVGEGLLRVVEAPAGTAFSSVRIPGLSIAGKTGTAETGIEGQDHAWFAGYVPADKPRFAFVVVLEHAGSGAEAAGPIARSLVQRMHQLEYFDATETADKSFPPGKG